MGVLQDAVLAWTMRPLILVHMVRRCSLKRVEISVESAWIQRLKLKHDEPLSVFAFNCNLRRY